MSAAGTTATSLLQRVKAGQAESWRRLVHLYTPLVYGWCRKAGLGADDSCDTTQEVFAAVAAGIDRFWKREVGDSFRAWLRGITRHKLSDHWRRRAQRPVAEGGSEARQRLAQVAADEDEPSQASEAQGALYRRALDLMRLEFEDKSWQAFWRVSVEDERPADVAAALGITLNAVYIARSRILRRLREELDDLV